MNAILNNQLLRLTVAPDWSNFLAH